MEDQSIGKETRSFLPFLDRLDLQSLLMDQEQLTANVHAPAPVAPAAQSAFAPVSSSSAAPALATGGPLMTVPAPAAPEAKADGMALPGGNVPNLATTSAVISTNGSAFQASGGAVSFKGGDTSGASHGNHNGGSGPGHTAVPREAGTQPTPTTNPATRPDSDTDPNEGPGPYIAASIVQTASVDQDTVAQVTVSGSADVTISASSDVTIDQIGLLDIDIERGPASPALPGPDASGSAIAVSPGTAAATVPSANIDHDGVNDVAISLAQDADIDTIVHLDINGFDGEIFITTDIGEETDIDQFARPVVTFDGDGDGIDVNISQFLDIDILSDIDIDISEDNGRLFIKVSVLDRARGSDTALVDLSDSEDDLVDVDFRQSVDVDQQVVVHVDIEQELAALFDVDVDVDADIDVTISQNAQVAIGIETGVEVDVDVDGQSDVDIVNALNIRIDFTAN